MMESVNQLHRFLNGHKGKLYKQGHVFKNWKQRYFVLEKKKVKYFEEDNLLKVIGEYNLDINTQIFDVPGESDGHKFLFYLISKNTDSTDDILYISASSDKDKKEWIEAFSDAIHNGFKFINQPEVWNNAFYPSVDLCLAYPFVYVENGNILKPTFVEHAPKVSFRSSVDNNLSDRYSLVMIDFDSVGDIAPDSAASNALSLQWGVVNMLGADLATGHEIVAYKPPAPAYNSGLHRFFFLLFKHPSLLTTTQLSETVKIFRRKDRFQLYEWTSLLGLGSPVGINGFYSGWEEYCDALHERDGHLPPVAYRSHKQDSAVLARSEQFKIEQCKLDLYADLSLQDVFPPSQVDMRASNNLRSLSLGICFGGEMKQGSVIARDGNILAPSTVQIAPQVSFTPLSLEGDSCDYYSLLLVDPDAPSRVSPLFREFVHWVVLNIPGSDVCRGVEVVPYLGSAPPYGSGLHRYVFSLYKQTGLLSPSVVENSRTFFAGRGGLQTHEWVRNHCRGLLVSVPVALEAFLCEWDSSVDALHMAMGWMPPVPYQSPSQQQALAAEGDSKLISTAEDDELALAQLLREEDAFRAIGDCFAEPSSSSSDTSQAEHPASEDLSTSQSASLSTPLVKNDSPLKRPVSVAALVKKYSLSSIEDKISASSSSGSSAIPLQSIQQSQLLAPVRSVEQNVATSTSSIAHSNIVTTTVTTSSSTAISSSTSSERSSSTQMQRVTETQEAVDFSESQQTTRLAERSQHSYQDQPSPAPPPQEVQSSFPPIQAPSSPTGSSSDRSVGGSLQKKISFKSDVDVLLAGEREKRAASTSINQSLRGSAVASSIAPPAKKFVQRNASLASVTTTGATAKKPSVQRSPSVAATASGGKPSSTGPAPMTPSREKSVDPVPSPKATAVPTNGSTRTQNVTSDSNSPSDSRHPSATLVRKTSTASSASSGSNRGGGSGSSEEVRIRSLTARNTAELCEICGITTTSVFDGETMKKKFSKDFMFKDSFLWVEALTRTLHWGKSVADKANAANQKYLSLDHIAPASRISMPRGECKGVLRSVEVSGANIVLMTEAGEVLEMKLSPDGYPPANKRANDWAKVMRAFQDAM